MTLHARIRILFVSTMLLTAATASLAQYRPPKPPALLKFTTMVGVSGAFLGQYDVRGIVGDDLPWVSGRIKGVLLANGRLNVRVRGLVFPDDPSVPPEARGLNNEATFRAVVSCMTDDAFGNVTTENLSTAGFPATASGNADIVATVTLPDPCAAPIVFIVAGSSDRWFAMTGGRVGGY